MKNSLSIPVLTSSRDFEENDLKPYCFGGLQFQIVNEPPVLGFYFLFLKDKNELCLMKAESKDKGLLAQFTNDFAEYKRQKISANKDLLARALNLDVNKKICDLTMGLAQDSGKLIYFGVQVTAVERHPFVAALVQNALIRESENPLLQNMKIHFGDMKDFVKILSASQFDAYYLDPMFSHKRSALPKKDMQYLADLVEMTSDSDYLETMEHILRLGKRLVVKRARQAEPLCNLKPKHAIEGKMIRFDVY